MSVGAKSRRVSKLRLLHEIDASIMVGNNTRYSMYSVKAITKLFCVRVCVPTIIQEHATFVFVCKRARGYSPLHV